MKATRQGTGRQGIRQTEEIRTRVKRRHDIVKNRILTEKGKQCVCLERGRENVRGYFLILVFIFVFPFSCLDILIYLYGPTPRNLFHKRQFILFLIRIIDPKHSNRKNYNLSRRELKSSFFFFCRQKKSKVFFFNQLFYLYKLQRYIQNTQNIVRNVMNLRFSNL